MSISHSVLLVSVPTLAQLQSPEYLQDGIRAAVAQTRKSLLVIVFSPLFSTSLNRQLLLGPVRESLKKNTAKQWKEVQKLLTFIYVQSAKRAQELDNILLSVDVVLRDSGAQSIPPKTLKSYGADTWEHVFVLDGDDEIPLDDLPISSIPTTILHPTSIASPADLLNPSIPSPSTRSTLTTSSRFETPSSIGDASAVTYPVVALGGTFDHLHAGHKILLSVAAWIATRKVIVGITDESLLKKKSNPHLLEPISTRVASVRSFCERFEPSLEYDIVPISDVYGPTAWDADVQALVLSWETREGADAIAKLRQEKNLPPLEPFVIDVISSDSTRLDPEDAVALKHGKMSSTAIREWITRRGREGKEA